MTTIAACPILGLMVTDSGINDGDQKWTCGKVERINGTLYGSCGDAIDGEKFSAWLRTAKWGEPPTARKPKLDVDSFNALALNESGLYWFDDKLYPMQVHEPFAIGSGGKAVKAALLAGAGIVRAVEIVCEIDAGSSGDVVVHTVKG